MEELTCPFCGAFALIFDGKWIQWDSDIELYFCTCGAVWFEGMPDEVSDDARSD